MSDAPILAAMYAQEQAILQAMHQQQIARERYGYVAAYLEHPEVGPILMRAAAEEWTAERLRGALGDTQWWKDTTEAQRVWDARESTDKSSADADVQAKLAELRAMAGGNALAIPDARLQTIARDALRNGWNEAQVRAALGSEVRRDPAIIGSGTMTAFRKLAGDYAVPVTDQALSTWVADTVAGTQSQESFQAWLIGQAKSLHPTITSALDQGMTVRDYMDPYVAVAAQSLGINPNEIQLNDGKWTAALNVTDPTGARRPMTLDEWGQHIRKDSRYGWDRSREAQDQVFAFGQELGRMFGKVA